jgi:rhodanese-related sulfurtransferase
VIAVKKVKFAAIILSVLAGAVLLSIAFGRYTCGCADKNAARNETKKTGTAAAGAAQKQEDNAMTAQPSGGIIEVSPSELDQMKSEKDVVLLDVRQAAELTGPQGAIPGVVNIPLPELPARLSELDKSKKIVTICLSGGRSTAAAQLLVKSGFTKVYNLKGGMTAYNRK